MHVVQVQTLDSSLELVVFVQKLASLPETVVKDPVAHELCEVGGINSVGPRGLLQTYHLSVTTI